MFPQIIQPPETIKDFSKLAIKYRHSNPVYKDVPIYKIPSFHLLTQFVGYAKYINRRSGNILLRGQTELFEKGLVPSLFRNMNSMSDPSETVKVNMSKHGMWRNKIASKSEPYFKYMYPDVLDPLLQHYGIKTHWLDVVDNLWVALWFASHETTVVSAGNRQFVHWSVKDENENGYVFLLCSDATVPMHEDQLGIQIGAKTKLVDLRIACPSVFLRPHAQHALMISKRGIANLHNYNDLIIGIAEIKVKSIMEWIGQNGLMSVQSLFPPAIFDVGYQELIDKWNLDRSEIYYKGSIQIISC